MKKTWQGSVDLHWTAKLALNAIRKRFELKFNVTLIFIYLFSRTSLLF